MKSLVLIAVAILFSIPSFADIWVSPGSVMFGQVKAGNGQYRQRSVQVQNRGEATRVSVGGYCGGNFRVTNNCYNLNKYGTCYIDITFRPTSKGSHHCNIDVRDLKTGRSQRVYASGYGI